MRALQFTAYGGPEVLTWADAPVPHAGPGQIRIAVRAASVNPADWKLLAGAMSGGQRLAGPGYLGYDAAGVVDEAGEGVTGVSVGDEVFGRGRGTQAEYAVLDAWAAKPPAIDWAVAAGAGVAGDTSERGLRLLGVQAGDTVFVDGGAGGVGAVSGPSQVLSIANFAAGQAGARVTGGSADSRPMEALAQVAGLLAHNKLVIKVQTFPFDRAAEAYRISLGGHVRGKLVLIP
jgi:NADPH:quinone reductase-like Zn-dependent oxidoreductase